MRIFFDTEFQEDGKTIELISIGMVREDGRTYYAESSEYDLKSATPWLQANVLPYLKNCARPRKMIANQILEFCGDSPEFWADYASYDWVVLCQLFGLMINIPHGWPSFVFDIQQLSNGRLLPDYKGIKHNALNDAIYCKSLYEYLTGAE
jgi:hypothetical protein